MVLPLRLLLTAGVICWLAASKGDPNGQAVFAAGFFGILCELGAFGASVNGAASAAGAPDDAAMAGAGRAAECAAQRTCTAPAALALPLPWR